jgi:hypothetical protein
MLNKVNRPFGIGKKLVSSTPMRTQPRACANNYNVKVLSCRITKCWRTKMERKVDTEFTVTWYGDQVKLIVVKEEGCKGCLFSKGVGCLLENSLTLGVTGHCSSSGRKDKISVVFKEVTNATSRD